MHFVLFLRTFALTASGLTVIAATVAAREPLSHVGLHPQHGLAPTTHLAAHNHPQSLVLKIGEPIQREIEGGETQVLIVSLQRGQFARVVFEWRGMDLDVHIKSPSVPQESISRTYVRGSRSLSVSFIADADGDYRLTVKPVENAKISGSYGVVLEAVGSPTLTDQKHIEAAKLLLEGEQEKSKDTAAQKLLHAVDLWNEIGVPAGAVYALQLLGKSILTRQSLSTADLDSSQLSQGDFYYGKAIEIAKGGNRRQLAYTLLEVGADYANLTSPRKALPYYKQSREIFRDLSDRRGEATALYRIGFAEATVGNMREALKWYEQALAVQQAESDRLAEAKTLNAMGGAYNVLAEQDRALSFYRRAEPVWKELDDRYREAITVKNIGVIYDDWGDWQTAKDHYLKSLSMLEALLSTKDLNSCKTTIVNQDAQLCNSIANTLDNVGELYNSLGDPESALNTLSECLTIRKTLKVAKGTGATLSRIAYSYLLENNPQEALNYCNQAMPFSQQADDLRKQGSILTFMGMAHAGMGLPEKAVDYYQRALQLQRETGERRGEGITLDQMGKAYVQLQDASKASATFDQALRLWRDIKEEEWETRTLYNIAELERDRGNLVIAQSQIDTALQLVESRRGNLRNLELRTTYFANKDDLYELNVDLKMQRAIVSGSTADLASALEISEKARARTFVDTLNNIGFDRRTNVEFMKSNPKLAELVDRKQILQGKLNSKRQSQIAVLSTKHTPEQAAVVAREIDALKNEYDQIQNQIRSQDARYAELTNPQSLNLAKIQQQLDGNSVLIEYALGEKRSYVWVVAPDSIKGFELGPRAQIEATANRLVNALTSRSRSNENETPQQRQVRIRKEEAEYPKASAALSKMVIGPVASLLGRKRLVVVADGALQYVPFSALLIPSTTGSIAGEASKQNSAGDRATQRAMVPIISQNEIVTLPSASVLALQRREIGNRKPAPLSIAILADPVFDADDERVTKARTSSAGNGSVAQTPPAPSTDTAKSPTKNGSETLSAALRSIGVKNISWLPSSRAEADAIRKVAPKNETFTALDFDASRVTATSPSLANYKILHIATHGVMDLEHPELSGVILSMVDKQGKPVDGYLRLHEIYNLNLPAELVVLSACQTGVGKQIKGEGLIALTRGFMYAGAKSVVASYWKVDDKATSELMAEFYKQMFVNKLKPAAALRQAQIKMSQSRRWQNPSYWAGFFLQGEWN